MANEKATITPLDSQDHELTDRILTVDFNPQTLRLSYQRSGTSGAQSQGKEGAAQTQTVQSTGDTVRLSVELLFDSTTDGPNSDVQNKTRRLVEMMSLNPDGRTTSGSGTTRVIFQWGSLIFRGQITSMEETLDYFSDQGKPLRSTVSLSLNGVPSERQTAQGAGSGAGAGIGLSAAASVGGGLSAGFSASANFSAGASFSAGAAVGTTPLTLAQSGDTLQGLSARAGLDWRAVAEANGVENPRQMQAGAVLNLNAGFGS